MCKDANPTTPDTEHSVDASTRLAYFYFACAQLTYARTMMQKIANHPENAKKFADTWLTDFENDTRSFAKEKG